MRESGYSITPFPRAVGYGDVNENTPAHHRSPNAGDTSPTSPGTPQADQDDRHGHPADLLFRSVFHGAALRVGRQAAEYGYDLLLSAQQPGEEELNAYRRRRQQPIIDGVVARARAIPHVSEGSPPPVCGIGRRMPTTTRIRRDGRAGVHRSLHLAAGPGASLVLSPPHSPSPPCATRLLPGLAEAAARHRLHRPGDLTPRQRPRCGCIAPARAAGAADATSPARSDGTLAPCWPFRTEAGRGAVAASTISRRSERQPAADHRPAADYDIGRRSGHAHVIRNEPIENRMCVGSRIDCAGIERWNDLSRPVTRRMDAKQVER